MLYNIGDIRYTDTEKPEPVADQALVRILRCGICGSDIPRIYRTGAHNMPLIPGHEMMGVVERCDTRPDLVGKRAGIFPLIPCNKCPNCLTRSYEMCEHYDYLGSRSNGGFAEYVAVPVWNLLPVPDEVSDDEAAMLEPMGVAVHAIRQAGLLNPNSKGRDVQAATITEGYSGECPGEGDLEEQKNIVVCGLGTIGLLVALFLKDGGYQNVFCIGNKDVQRQKLMDMGYSDEQFCDVRSHDPKAYILEKTGGRGADYYFECIGRSEGYAQAVDCTGARGHIVLVGNPASDMNLPREIYWKILRNQMVLHGTWNSSFFGIDGQGDDWRYVLDRLSDWQMGFRPSDLITHRYDLSRLQEGLEIMRDKTEEYVKIMVTNEWL